MKRYRLAAIAFGVLAVLLIAACDPQIDLTVHSGSGETVTSVVNGTDCVDYGLSDGRVDGTIPRSCVSTGDETISFLLDGEPVQFKVLGDSDEVSRSGVGPHDSIEVDVTSDPHGDLVVELVAPSGAGHIDAVDDVTTEMTSEAGAAVAYTAPSAEDGSGTAIGVVCDLASGSTFPRGTTPVTCTTAAIDGVVLETTFEVTVDDTTPPVLTVPEDVEVIVNEEDPVAVAFGAATATDLVDPAPAISNDAPALFPTGEETVVTWTALDWRGNASRETQTVTVNYVALPLVLADAADVAAEAESASGATVTFAPPTASKDGATVECLPASGGVFALGSTEVTCKATLADESAEAKFSVVVADTTAPTLTQPADIAVTGTSVGKVVSYALPTASDAVDSSLVVACSPASGSTFGLATTVVTCSATDAAGNTGNTTFNVVVNELDIPSALPGVGCPATGKGGSFPPFPTFAKGTATLNGAPVADGTTVFAILRHSNPASLFDLTGAEDPVCYVGTAVTSGGSYTLTVSWPSDDYNWFPAEFYIQLAGELVGYQATPTPNLTGSNYKPAGTVIIDLSLTIPE